jgi:indolepyruvate ferredoxin oxidoreductase beta subunit
VLPPASFLHEQEKINTRRPAAVDFIRERGAIDAWLRLAEESARDDYELACEIIECQQVLKSYGETHEHGKESFALLMDAARRLTGRDGGAGTLARLRAAALADEDGAELRDAVAALDDMPSPTP